jgi:GTPase SAR1 family protein
MSSKGTEKSKALTKATSPSPLSGTKYNSLNRQKLNEIIKYLRECGTEKVVDLPKIVVVGNQSAGKSSLIEAISLIKMPRLVNGTCTRCPMEVILNKAPPETWSCSISLRTEERDGSMEASLFAVTKDPNEVTLLLRQAQLAILNPGTPASTFRSLDEQGCVTQPRKDNFSKNTVVVEITGADVDVTFIDLPGIISNPPKARSSSLLL